MSLPGKNSPNTGIASVNNLGSYEMVIEESNEPFHLALKPAFDMVWNAFGLVRSLNYDEAGNRVTG